MNQPNYEIFANMQEGKPLKSYKKTIKAKVYVQVLDPISRLPVGRILFSDARNPDEAIVDVWSIEEDLFFKRTNKHQLDIGNIIEHVRTEEETNKEPTIESYSDEKLTEVVNSKFLALQAVLNKVESEAPLLRMLDIATKEEKSEKIINAIKARLSEIQKLPVS